VKRSPDQSTVEFFRTPPGESYEAHADHVIRVVFGHPAVLERGYWGDDYWLLPQTWLALPI
jgi:hypothetical protein